MFRATNKLVGLRAASLKLRGGVSGAAAGAAAAAAAASSLATKPTVHSGNSQRLVGGLALAAGVATLAGLASAQRKDEGAVECSAAPPPVDWNKLRARIVDLLDDEKYDDGSWGPVFVRLAWHAAGTYDAKTKRGGSEGAYMRYAHEAGWGANAGLALPRARLEALKAEFPGVSFADLWSFAGTVAIEEMGGPKMKWRPGRKDAAQALTPVLPDGLLPDADGRDKKNNPADHLRDIFGRMGFNDREIVALSGAHALGRCHEDRSGFWGPWTRAPTTFSNEYFRLLLDEKWTPKKTHKGKPWTGPAQFEDKTGELMMLPTDLALVRLRLLVCFSCGCGGEGVLTPIVVVHVCCAHRCKTPRCVRSWRSTRRTRPSFLRTSARRGSSCRSWACPPFNVDGSRGCGDGQCCAFARDVCVAESASSTFAVSARAPVPHHRIVPF